MILKMALSNTAARRAPQPSANGDRFNLISVSALISAIALTITSGTESSTRCLVRNVFRSDAMPITSPSRKQLQLANAELSAITI